VTRKRGRSVIGEANRTVMEPVTSYALVSQNTARRIGRNGGNVMEFGVFQGASVGPRPWDETEPQRIRDDVEMGVEADRAGFDTFWAPEHHCLEEYSHNSSSHLSCLAVGMRTENIRLVTGIFNLCPPINHPVRVGEQIAYIDILTNGRIELGTGRGSGSTEVNTFGITNE